MKFVGDEIPVLGAELGNKFFELSIFVWPPMASGAELCVPTFPPSFLFFLFFVFFISPSFRSFTLDCVKRPCRSPGLPFMDKLQVKLLMSDHQILHFHFDSQEWKSEESNKCSRERELERERETRERKMKINKHQTSHIHNYFCLPIFSLYISYNVQKAEA